MRVGYAFLVVLWFAVTGWTQSADRVEVFGGYSFAAHDFTGGLLYSSNTSLTRGWNASANIKLNRMSQFVADFGGYYFPPSSVWTLMVGPQLSAPLQSRVTPFVHALLGVALAPQNFGSFRSNHSFMMALGGGIDYSLTRHFGLRGQADYLRTNFTSGDNQVPFQNNNARVSVGLIARF